MSLAISHRPGENAGYVDLQRVRTLATPSQNMQFFCRQGIILSCNCQVNEKQAAAGRGSPNIINV